LNYLIGGVTAKKEKIQPARRKSKRETGFFCANLDFKMLRVEDEQQNKHEK